MTLDPPVLPSAPPPLCREVGRWRIEPTITAPRALRHEILQRWGSDPRAIDEPSMGRLALVLTELVTHAVLHGEDSITVTLGRTSASWLVVVSQHPPPLARPNPRPAAWQLWPTDSELGGQGLAIVATVARAAGWVRSPGELIVWAQVPSHLGPTIS